MYDVLNLFIPVICYNLAVQLFNDCFQPCTQKYTLHVCVMCVWKSGRETNILIIIHFTPYVTFKNNLFTCNSDRYNLRYLSFSAMVHIITILSAISNFTVSDVRKTVKKKKKTPIIIMTMICESRTKTWEFWRATFRFWHFDDFKTFCIYNTYITEVVMNHHSLIFIFSFFFFQQIDNTRYYCRYALYPQNYRSNNLQVFLLKITQEKTSAIPCSYIIIIIIYDQLVLIAEWIRCKNIRFQMLEIWFTICAYALFFFFFNYRYYLV
jgi:hypothetical protein